MPMMRSVMRVQPRSDHRMIQPHRFAVIARRPPPAGANARCSSRARTGIRSARRDASPNLHPLRAVLLCTKTIHRVRHRIVRYLRRRMHGTTCHHPRCNDGGTQSGGLGPCLQSGSRSVPLRRTVPAFSSSKQRTERRGPCGLRVGETIRSRPDGPGPTAPRAIGCRFRFHPTKRARIEQPRGCGNGRGRGRRT